MKKKTIAISAVAAALVLSVGCVTAFADESDTFSFLTGQQRTVTRNELYEQAAELPEEEQTDFLAENGIAENPHTDEAAESYSYTTGQEIGTSYAPEAEDESGYSYLTGQQNSTNRNDLYTQAEQLPEDEQDAFLAENGIGETPYSEEVAASYSFVTGQQRGSSYRQSDDTECTQDMSGYSYLTGQERGASYHQ